MIMYANKIEMFNLSIKRNQFSEESKKIKNLKYCPDEYMKKTICLKLYEYEIFLRIFICVFFWSQYS